MKVRTKPVNITKIKYGRDKFGAFEKVKTYTLHRCPRCFELWPLNKHGQPRNCLRCRI